MARKNTGPVTKITDGAFVYRISQDKAVFRSRGGMKWVKYIYGGPLLVQIQGAVEAGAAGRQWLNFVAKTFYALDCMIWDKDALSGALDLFDAAVERQKNIILPPSDKSDEEELKEAKGLQEAQEDLKAKYAPKQEESQSSESETGTA